MKIWIDFINTPQVSFWVPFIEDFVNSNHEVILTCRDSGNTVGLLKQNNLNFKIIGESVGKSTFQKILFFPKRLVSLYLHFRLVKLDIAVSQSSFYQPIVAKFLGVRCIYTNDNEHAMGNLAGFLFASQVILPVALSNETFTARWPLKSKLSFYPSVKESIYLSQNPLLLSLTNSKKDTIYFRPEPWSAQYYDGPLNFFDSTLLSLIKENYKIVILPRDKNQITHYKQAKFKGLKVADNPLKLIDIVSNCKLFIGAGGSMTRELAVLGVAVVSIYQATILCVDRILVENGSMTINPEITYAEINKILAQNNTSTNNLNELAKGIDSFQIIKNLIFSNTKT